MNADLATLIGGTGVTLLLLAFLLNIARLMPAQGRPYMLANFLGASLACYSSYLIEFMPFVVLEGVWAAAALVALARTWFPRPPGR
jgi:hypothetical protein